MDLPSTIGTVLGVAAATFAAVWKFFVSPVKRQLEETAPSVKANAQATKDLVERLATLESQNKEMCRRLDEYDKTVDNLEARVNRTVTSEEFAAHSGSTAEALRGLSEKVGQARGAIESWLTTRR